MTRLLAAALLLVLASTAEALGPTLNHCIFEWQQPANADLGSFKLMIADVAAGPYALLGQIPADANQGSAPQSYVTANLCATQSQGQKFVKLVAVDRAGNEGPAGVNDLAFVLDNVVEGPGATGFLVR